MDITIAIVSYNTSDLLVRCLSSIYKYTKNVSFEVIVVDNASSDDTVNRVKKKFPQVKLIQNNKNNFFSKANNQALEKAKGKYFLVLAPDSYFFDNSIKLLVRYLNRNPDIGAVDGLEYYENNKLVPTGSLVSTPLIDFYELSFIGKHLSNKSLLRKYRIKNISRKKEFSIDVGCDAFLCIRTKLMRNIRGFNEDLLLYYTENDICKKIKDNHYKIMHYPKAQIVHNVSVSVSKIGWKKYEIYYKDMLTFYNQNGYSFSGKFLYLLLICELQFYKLKYYINAR